MVSKKSVPKVVPAPLAGVMVTDEVVTAPVAGLMMASWGVAVMLRPKI